MGGASEVGLEEGVHLGVAGPGFKEDGEVDVEDEGVEGKGKADEEENAGEPVGDVGFLWVDQNRMYWNQPKG